MRAGARNGRSRKSHGSCGDPAKRRETIPFRPGSGTGTPHPPRFRPRPGPLVPSEPMRVLVTGVSGYVGAALVAAPAARRPRRARLRPLARARGGAGLELDELVARRRRDRRRARRGAGRDRRRLLPDPLDGGRRARAASPTRERRAARAPSPTRPRAAGVRRIVYLGGLVPAGRPVVAPPRPRAWRSRRRCSPPCRRGSRCAPRSSIGARSRSFRFLVRLIERMPVLALPAWRDNRTAPIDGRDVLEFLARAATRPAALAGGRGTSAAPT